MCVGGGGGGHGGWNSVSGHSATSEEHYITWTDLTQQGVCSPLRQADSDQLENRQARPTIEKKDVSLCQGNPVLPHIEKRHDQRRGGKSQSLP